jgi:glyoxylate reductase
VAPRVVITSELPVDPAPFLPGCDIAYGRTGEHIRDADALVCLLRDRVDAALLDAAPRLRVVANVAVGYDNIDVAAATARGICVANTPDVLTEATADLAFGLALAAARRLGEGERLLRGGGWGGWELGQLLGVDVWGKTLGVIGLGRIGLAMARRGRGFAMDVLYAQPRPAATAAEVGAVHVASDDLFARADVISLHCPLTAQTRNLIDARALARMKPTAVVVNTARGACVDEAALAAALAAGTIFAAGLDVFADEPRVHPALVAQERAVLAPHVGSATTSARRRMAELALGAVRAVLGGERPANLVDPAVWDRRRA